MANHGFVKTKKFMNFDRIQNLLEDLNLRLFKNKLQIKSSLKPKVIWNVKYEGYDYGSLNFWLNSSRFFEIRHNSNGFMWWIDSVILNEIAVCFSGIISDEGVSEKWHGTKNKYNDFWKFQEKIMFNGFPKKEKKLLLSLIKVPIEFRK
mgnify:CR=1 FL=1